MRRNRKQVGEPEPDRQFVYFVQRQSDDAIKIGCSIDPAQRTRGLSSACKCKVELLGTLPGGRRVERTLHERFAAFRLPDGVGTQVTSEWFRPEPELLWFIAENAEQQTKPDGPAPQRFFWAAVHPEWPRGMVIVPRDDVDEAREVADAVLARTRGWRREHAEWINSGRPMQPTTRPTKTRPV